jgi:hypothetical protein
VARPSISTAPASASSPANTITVIQRERRDDQRSGGGVGHDGPPPGQRDDEGDHRAEGYDRDQVLHHVDGGDGGSPADDRAQRLVARLLRTNPCS